MSNVLNAKRQANWSAGRFVCVGLDPEYRKIPDRFHRLQENGALNIAHTITDFIKHIVLETREHAGAYKPNAAFYERHGVEGLVALQNVSQLVLDLAPHAEFIFDNKRADIGNTNNGYAEAAFDHLGADSMTTNPYFGREALEPFLSRTDKGIYVLCRTSNPGADEFQEMLVAGLPLYLHVALHVAQQWNQAGNCGLVVGATAPEQLRIVREAVGDDITFLIPGVGAQGGDLEKSYLAGRNANGSGMYINSSRGIIFAKDPATEARKINESIRMCR